MLVSSSSSSSSSYNMVTEERPTPRWERVEAGKPSEKCWSRRASHSDPVICKDLLDLLDPLTHRVGIPTVDDRLRNNL